MTGTLREVGLGAGWVPPPLPGGDGMVSLGLWRKLGSGVYDPTPAGELLRSAWLGALELLLPGFLGQPEMVLRPAVRPSPRRLLSFTVLPLVGDASDEALAAMQLGSLLRALAALGCGLSFGRTRSGSLMLSGRDAGLLDVSIATHDRDAAKVFVGAEALEVALARSPALPRIFGRTVGIQPLAVASPIATRLAESLRLRGLDALVLERPPIIPYPVFVKIVRGDKYLVSSGFGPDRKVRWCRTSSDVVAVAVASTWEP